MGEGSPSVGILSSVTSAVVVHKVSSQEGIYGMYVTYIQSQIHELIDTWLNW